MSSMRHFVTLLAVATLVTIALAPAKAAEKAEDYPSRPVRIIVPFGAGGPTDVFTRAIAEELRKSLHQTFVQENKPGAGTTIGTDYVAKAAPDGYTLLMVSGTQTVNETLFNRKPYHLMHDLVAVAPLIESDLVLVIHPSVPAKTMTELIALARAKPGTLNFGSSGPGSNYHMAAELLKHLTGINIVHVPYKGSTGMRTDILSGQIQILFDSVPTMAALVKAGKVRALGTSGRTRSPILPNVPAIAETVPGFAATLWVGFMAPAATPQPIIDKLNSEISKILSRDDIHASWKKQGAVPLIMTQARFTEFMNGQVATWAKVIQDNHIALIK
jgi:tripartite-type tricarboxylate transporter receptor subunit TctC